MDNIVKKAINGNKDAFIQIMKSIETKLYYIAYSKLDNAEDVKDVIQETIYQSYKSIKQLRNPEKFESWVLSILFNNCNKFYKNKDNHNTSVEKDEITTIDSTDQYNKIENKIDFLNLLNILSKDDKEIFVLFYVNDYTTAKISEILKINENTVKTKLKRSREKIKEYLERRDKYEL